MSTRLEDRVALWLSTHPGSSLDQIAQGVLASRVSVRDVLGGPLFTYSNRAGQRVYRLGGKAQETDCEFLLRVLSDGKPHNLNQILRRSFAERGCGLTVHSRAAEVRKQGYEVVNWKDGERGDGSWYQLQPLDADTGPLVSASSGPASVASPASAPDSGQAAQPDGQLVLSGSVFRRGGN